MKRSLYYLIPLLLAAIVGALFGDRAHAQDTADDVEVMLAVDTSGSMRHAIEAAKAAANEFIMAMPADVRIGLVGFGDDVAVLASPTTDRALLSAQVNGIVADGDTALYDAVVAARQQFTPAAERKVLVILSDGKDDGSTAALGEAVAAVQGEHVEAISLTTPETDLASLQALGRVTSADDPAGVSAAFARVADLLTPVVAPTTVPTTAAPTTTEAPTTTTEAPTTTTEAPTTTTEASTTTEAPATSTAPPTTVYSRPPAPPAANTGSGSDSSPDRSLWLGGGGIFAGLLIVGLLLFPRQRVSKARLGINKPRNVSDLGKRTMSAVEEVLERHGKRAELATALSVADISAQPGAFVAMVALVALVAGLLGLLIGGPVVALIVAVVVCFTVRFYVRRKKAKRQTAFADQLPDVLQLITTALRSGYGITQALESVAEEAEEPARSEFAHVLVESRLGRDLSEALHALARRIESADLEWVVSAIDINRDTGGNLSEILNTVSVTIRERQRMARHVRTLTAEGRLSARILTVLPLAICLWQWLVNPDNFALLLSGVGLAALIVAGIFMTLGSIWVRRIVNSIAL
jgi:tight adherence protein B